MGAVSLLQKPAAQGLYTAPDGAEIYYEDTGGPDPVLFFIYGLGCSIRHWKYPMAHLAKGHRLIWLDFRGHGRSGRPPRGQRLTIATIVDDMRALCAYRGVEAATFLGQSMGGVMALALAHAAPELARGLVLLASPGRDVGAHLPAQPAAGWLWQGMIALNRHAPLAVRLGYAAVKPLSRHPALLLPIREVIRHTGFNPDLARTDDIDEYLGKVLEVDPNLFYDMAADLREFDVAALSPPVACPTLIIAGARDQVVPLAESERLARLIPRAQLEVVPHGSHCPHFDDPGLVCRRMAEFLREQGL